MTVNTNDQINPGSPGEIVKEDNLTLDHPPPPFSGKPLQWFTFWDSFEAAVHSNSSLGDVQNFSYL